MSVSVSRKVFLDSQAAVIMREELLRMIDNPAYNTGGDEDLKTEFVEKHLNYISRFHYIDPLQYILNLKMKSRIF